ncbi:MAG: J domain-containing protein [Bacteroidia bacterium]|nr:J domain-containing protein [Bacteroidia bacterium]MCF8427690.1 J domain-containing protein [Bacteroidia bacterium]MCF8447372.1 J domain-containing protein [Bacteroidia bacterium]
MIEQYYEILGVNKHATLADIKKAYRQKAKQLHPDVNNSPDANEEFILINEAYEYLQNIKTGKIYRNNKESYSGRKTNYQTNEDWERTEREEARARAQRHAQMEYEAFIKTDFYKTTLSLNVIADFFSILTTLLIFTTPIIGYFHEGTFGIFGGLLMVFVTVDFWTDILIHNRPKLNLNELVFSIVHLGKTKTFQIVIASIVNLILIYQIGFSTLIPLWILLAVFCFAIAFGYLLTRKQASTQIRQLAVFVIAPELINLFLLLNFLFSTNITSETYTFNHEYQRTRWGWQKTTLIILNDDKYSDFTGIRVFFDFGKMHNSEIIEYKFADGLFGLRVMKSYSFKKGSGL